MKRIAVPTDGNKVAPHFGHCSHFTICEIEGDNISNQETIANPGHQPGFLPRFLSDKDIDVVLGGGMGNRAINLFDQEGIQVITGVRGSVDECLQAYVNNELETGDNVCDH